MADVPIQYGIIWAIFSRIQEITATLCVTDVPIQCDIIWAIFSRYTGNNGDPLCGRCGIIYELYFPDLQEITGSSAFWTDCTTPTKYFVKAPDIVNIDLYFLQKR